MRAEIWRKLIDESDNDSDRGAFLLLWAESLREPTRMMAQWHTTVGVGIIVLAVAFLVAGLFLLATS
jgi:hypothetical protein